VVRYSARNPSNSSLITHTEEAQVNLKNSHLMRRGFPHQVMTSSNNILPQQYEPASKESTSGEDHRQSLTKTVTIIDLTGPSEPEPTLKSPVMNDSSTDANSKVVDLATNCYHPVAGPDAPTDEFLILELPPGCVSGDRVQTSLPISSESEDTELGAKKAELHIAFIVPHDYKPNPEGNGFVILNVSLENNPRLIMPNPSKVPNQSEILVSRRFTPRKSPLDKSKHGFETHERVQPKDSAVTSNTASRVGLKYQVRVFPHQEGSEAYRVFKTKLTGTRLSRFMSQYELKCEDFW
jgi:hypothetical protein